MDRTRFEKEQPQLSRFLTRALREDKVPQALLLYGNQSCGFLDVTRFIAQTLSCDKNRGLACGECEHCQRFLKGVHPDFYEIDGDGINIKKDSIITLRDRFSLSAIENSTKRRVYAIYECENLTEEAANALLKFLEEPSAGVTAILCAPTPDSVLATIRSRCQILRINPLPREEIYNRLLKKEVKPELAYFLSDCSGDLERIQKYVADEDYVQTADLADEFIRNLNGSYLKSAEILHYIGGKLKKSKCYNYFYGDISRLCCDALSGEGSFGPYKTLLTDLARASASLLSRFIVILQRAMSQSSANMSFTGVLAELVDLLLDPNEIRAHQAATTAS